MGVSSSGMGQNIGSLMCRCLGQEGDVHAEADDDGEDASPGRLPVELAASELFSVPGVGAAYHTSVVVNGEEFFFSDSGVFCDRTFASHQGTPTERVKLGYTRRTGQSLLKVLQAHFKPGSYDLVRKNCNSFSDAALYYLMRKRLDRRFTAVERMAGWTTKEMIQSFTNGMYQPNPTAETFKVEDIIVAIDAAGDTLTGSSGSVGDAEDDDTSKLSIGSRVTLVGLKSCAELNGKGALVRGYIAMSCRWEVTVIASNETKAVCADNLRPAGEPVILMPGDRVALHSLQSSSGQSLNGREAEVLRYRHDLSRYEIRFLDDDSCEPKALKAENLKSI